MNHKQDSIEPTNLGLESCSRTKTSFTTDELLQVSRLITIGELSACFAHEVTNPLMLIRGHLRFVEESLTQDHPLRISFEVIDRASRRIEDIARRVLDFSRNREPQTEKCDIAELLAEAIRFVQPYFRPHYVDVQIHVEPDVPLVQMDRWRTIQVLVNLLQNAVDAMAENERRVLSLKATLDGSQVRIAVSDTGSGIPMAIQTHIFDPFFTTKGERGNGLGLYISKQLIEDAGGTIMVETGSQGTTFTVSLPL
jgi:C4-dicarboxylate-specific signal transduction histidine kinase